LPRKIKNKYIWLFSYQLNFNSCKKNKKKNKCMYQSASSLSLLSVDRARNVHTEFMVKNVLLFLKYGRGTCMVSKMKAMGVIPDSRLLRILPDLAWLAVCIVTL
jgi:hypothetical protein